MISFSDPGVQDDADTKSRRSRRLIWPVPAVFFGFPDGRRVSPAGRRPGGIDKTFLDLKINNQQTTYENIKYRENFLKVLENMLLTFTLFRALSPAPCPLRTADGLPPASGHTPCAF